MSGTGNGIHLDKVLFPLACALILIAPSYVAINHAFATCQPYGECSNNTIANTSLSFNKFSNSTFSFNQFANSTFTGNNSSLIFNQFSNSTNQGRHISFVLLEQQNITDAINYTNQTLVPQPDESFLFLSNSTNSTEQDKLNGDNSLYLQGNQYLEENSSAQNLKSLTISAWVKPDYSQGSSVFTVISDANAYSLAVNNNMPPQKMAVFSIFDGIKWTTVQSNSSIPEQWTFLVATFNGTSIELYVNGDLNGVSEVTGIPYLVDGELTTNMIQNITSDQNVTIGAYYEKTRDHTRNLFSGEISDVNLYEEVLTTRQIDQMYHNTRPER